MHKFISRYQSRLLAVLAALGFAAIAAQAQTVITGPNITTSTWSPAGNPYIVAANCTVPSGNTLTIQPGTIVWMGEGVSLTGNGIIQAAGTSGQRITFQAISGGGNWDTILVNNTTGTNQFKYCDFLSSARASLWFGKDFAAGTSQFNEVMYSTFSNSGGGVTFRVSSVNTVQFCDFQNVTNCIYMSNTGDGAEVIATRTQSNIIKNCVFENCSQPIYGQASGTAGHHVYNGWVVDWAQTCILNADIRNCFFGLSDSGVQFYISGQQSVSTVGRGHNYVTLKNNSFSDISGTAIWLRVGSVSGSSTASLINNSFASAGSGVVVTDPWDATIQNNIFDGCASAVTRSGSLSATVSYNDFFGNTANFTGYPVTYGQVLLTNRNGTPSDVLYNIFQDPQFVASDDFHLQAGSACIDAGEGSAANFDSYFPPSQGTTFNDIGAYGGPVAGRWLDVAPYEPYVVPVAAIDLYVGVTVNPPSPGHYRLEYSTDLLDPNSWSQLTNMDMTTEPVIYYELPSEPQRFYRAVQQ
ncbi:MAG: right-handed parallel beta-helix repeat-containing protein [Kiritimatiellales bacterium]|nr:right-handed parallel beta-helix repeat-containing protein [Kiritimatiellales bacterium]MCF7864173.1 right-handed parallel beta-helix repeat-containing protein [Kiritimatiellales bacterium]